MRSNSTNAHLAFSCIPFQRMHSNNNGGGFTFLKNEINRNQRKKKKTLPASPFPIWFMSQWVKRYVMIQRVDQVFARTPRDPEILQRNREETALRINYCIVLCGSLVVARRTTYSLHHRPITLTPSAILSAAFVINGGTNFLPQWSLWGQNFKSIFWR